MRQMRRPFWLVAWTFFVFVMASVAAEFFAFSVGYSPVLGPRDFYFFYSPFKLIEWVSFLDVQGDSLTNALYLFAGGSIVSGGVMYLLYKLQGDAALTSHGASRWKTSKELEKGNYYKPGTTVLIMDKEGKYRNDRIKGWILKTVGRLIFAQGPEHVLLISPTARGKGIHLVIPSLVSDNGVSVFVLDMKKELFFKTAGWRNRFSYTFAYEPGAPGSVAWNPLEEIEPGIFEVSQTQAVAESICNPTGKLELSYWDLAASEWIVALILFVLHHWPEKNLAACYGLNKSFDMPQEELFKVMSCSDHKVVAAMGRQMLDRAPNEISGVVNTASSFLQIYADPIVAENTSRCDFKIKDLMYSDKPVSLYYVVQPNDRLLPLTRLFIDMVAAKNTQKVPDDMPPDERPKWHLHWYMDEFTNLGAVKAFKDGLSYWRGFWMKAIIITQSYGQIFEKYTKFSNIPDNCKYKVILGADTPEEAERVSKLLGQQTIEQENKSRNRKAGDVLISGSSESKSQIGRYLLTPDEVLHLPFDKAILVIGGEYPYYGSKIMSYLDPRIQPRVGLPFSDEEIKENVECLSSGASPWVGVTKIIHKKKTVEVDLSQSSSQSVDFNSVEIEGGVRY